MLIKFTVPAQERVSRFSTINATLNYVLPVIGVCGKTCSLYHLGSAELMYCDLEDTDGHVIEIPENLYIDFSAGAPQLCFSWDDGSFGGRLKIENVEFLNDYPIPEGFDHDH